MDKINNTEFINLQKENEELKKIEELNKEYTKLFFKSIHEKQLLQNIINNDYDKNIITLDELNVIIKRIEKSQFKK